MEEIVEDIKSLKIQGAKNVALAGIKAFILASDSIQKSDSIEFYSELCQKSKIIANARPTEPALRKAILFILHKLKAKDYTSEEMKKIVKIEGESYENNLKETHKKIAEITANLIEPNSTIITHCHSSTVVDSLILAKDKIKKVIVTETRPRYQGKITAVELLAQGIDVTYIVDSASAIYMKKSNLMLVGSDAVLSDGSVVNKIGTQLMAIAAKEYKTPVYVATGTHKFDPKTIQGIPEVIEIRNPDEIIDSNEVRNAEVFNPAFDITPPEYIKAISTEIGVIPPSEVYRVIVDKFGWMLKEGSFWFNLT